MNLRWDRRPVGGGVFSLLMVLVQAGTLMAADPVSASPSSVVSSDVSSLLKQLSSNKFRERVDAQRQLGAHVERHPQQIAEQIGELEPEAQLRLVRLLEESFLRNDNPVGDEAEKALDSIRRTDAIAAMDADMVLIGNSRLREGRAKIQIERLGGRLAYTIPIESRAPPTSPRVGIGFGEPAILQTILVSEDWSGTPEDLWHFRRLSHHSNLLMYNIRSNRLPLEDLMALSSDLPGLKVLERGAFLGVRGGSAALTMIVEEVVANSAAEAADLRPNDKIEMLEEHEVRNFAHLVDLLLDYAPGQTVHLKVRRNQELLEIPVKLSSWRRMPLTDPPIDLPLRRFPGPLGTGRPTPPALPERLLEDQRFRFRLE